MRLVTCIIFFHFACFSQFGLAKHMHVENKHLQVDWLSALHQGQMGASCLVFLCLCFRGEQMQTQLFGCVQVPGLLIPFKCGGLTTHLTAHNTDDDQEQEQQQKNKAKT